MAVLGALVVVIGNLFHVAMQFGKKGVFISYQLASEGVDCGIMSQVIYLRIS